MKTTRFAKPDFKPKGLFKLVEGNIFPIPELSGWGKMHQSDAVGTDVICDESGNKPFGMGWIKFPPNGEVKLHTHEGSHILTCFGGNGKVKVEISIPGERQALQEHDLSPGLCYNIESMVPHSVHAGPEGLLLLVIGNDYRHATATDRLQMISPDKKQ